jgi:hypothetical protein
LSEPNASTWIVGNDGLRVRIRGRNCEVRIDANIPQADRGDFLANVCPDPNTAMARDTGLVEHWPRYYFSLARAMLEVEAWLRRHGQWVDPPSSA